MTLSCFIEFQTPIADNHMGRTYCGDQADKIYKDSLGYDSCFRELNLLLNFMTQQGSIVKRVALYMPDNYWLKTGSFRRTTHHAHKFWKQLRSMLTHFANDTVSYPLEIFTFSRRLALSKTAVMIESSLMRTVDFGCQKRTGLDRWPKIEDWNSYCFDPETKLTLSKYQGSINGPWKDFFVDKETDNDVIFLSPCTDDEDKENQAPSSPAAQVMLSPTDAPPPDPAVQFLFPPLSEEQGFAQLTPLALPVGTPPRELCFEWEDASENPPEAPRKKFRLGRILNS